MNHRDITIIASDLLAAEKAQAVLREKNLMCRVVLSDLEDLPFTARQQVSQGAKVLIAFGMFAKVIRQNVDVPVIMVDIRPEDVMDAILEASRQGDKVAIIGFRNVLKDVLRIRELLRIELLPLPTVAPDEMEKSIAQISRDHILVGGYFIVRLAEKYGFRTVLLRPQDEEIIRAVEMAQGFLVREESLKEGGEVQNETSVYASVSIDPVGNIIMMNRLASQYLGIDQLNAVAFKMMEVCPEFTRVKDVISKKHAYRNQIAVIRENTFLYHAEPILAKDALVGVTVTFQDVDAVLSAEASIRRRMASRSNTAHYTLDNILGQSACMTQVMKLALRYASVDETVLITGETGVGKELFAQGIHSASARRKGPFVAINCASLPENILESELFGYVKGAFTGADREGKRGLFEQAHGGTIFLDEIGEISLSLQGKLLRVLQEHSIRRLGDDRPLPVDIRVITATNRDLIRMVREGKFRADLYFRINVLGLAIPPLRKRTGDVELLANNFLTEASVRDGRKYTLSAGALAAMNAYRWPGNIRELQNMVRRVTVISQGEVIEESSVRDYMEEMRGLSPQAEVSSAGESDSAVDSVSSGASGSSRTESMPVAGRKSRRGEMSAAEALRLSGDNKEEAAKLLGVSRATFYRRLKSEM